MRIGMEMNSSEFDDSTIFCGLAINQLQGSFSSYVCPLQTHPSHHVCTELYTPEAGDVPPAFLCVVLAEQVVIRLLMNVSS